MCGSEWNSDQMTCAACGENLQPPIANIEDRATTFAVQLIFRLLGFSLLVLCGPTIIWILTRLGEASGGLILVLVLPLLMMIYLGTLGVHLLLSGNPPPRYR